MAQEFKKAFAGLNGQQKKAVETIEGPVLVIAGPGTGKTQLLSTRVAYILKNTDTKPGNVLALTYTNKAAVNMRERIIQLVGQEGARVPANTFHSFAAEIMNLYPDYFWNAARLSIAPDSVQLDIIESIVSKLPLDNPLAQKFAGQYTLIRDIQTAINLTKDAGLTPEKLRVIINFNIAYIDTIEPKLAELTAERLSNKKLGTFVAEIEDLADQAVTLDIYPLISLSEVIKQSLHDAVETDSEAGKTTQTSRWKSRWVQTVDGQRGMYNERRRNDWWLNLADVYEQYRAELHRRGFYDYADMLVETIAQLEQNPEMLADVQERFSYVLVDEFQDSTPAQLRFVHLIADHFSAASKPNLMVVGDDDQTIFKFNGAEVNNMFNFERQYPSVKKIVLTENYRSAQDILDFAKQVIEQAETRLVKLDPSLNKELVAVNPPKETAQIRTLAFSASEIQMSAIGADIKKNYKSSGSIAVLARNHESLIRMAGILQQLDVPIRYEQAANILDHEIIKQIYLVAKLLLAIQEGDKDATNALIHQVLRWPAWGIEPKLLWQLAAVNYPDREWLESLLASKHKDLKAVGEWFVWLAQAADSQPLAVTIEQILGLRESDGFQSPVRQYLAKAAHNQETNGYFQGLSAVQLLRNLVHEFGLERQPKLQDLVRFVEVNKQNEVIIPDESPFITGDQAVQLLTVHKAKGLEFDRVYIIDAIDDNWRPRAGGRKPPANLPLQPVGDDLDDYIRLMYVAITRAKSAVTISGYYQDHSGRDNSLSSIIQSVRAFEKVDSKDKKVLTAVLEENLRWPQLSVGDETAVLKARLEGFNLNVTQLEHFLDVENYGPQYFKERYLLLLPELKTPAQSYGTAMHAAMKQAQLMTNAGLFSAKKVIDEFNKALGQEQLAPVEHKRYAGQGRRTLERLFGKFKYQLPKGALGEHRLRNVRLQSAVLSGTLDRVDKQAELIVVADYKTGRPLGSFATKGRNQQLKAYKHKLQLTFYALLLAASDPMLAGKVAGQMVYVEADNAKQLTREYTPGQDEIERLARLVEVVWHHIQNLDFPDISKYQKSATGVADFEKDLLKE